MATLPAAAPAVLAARRTRRDVSLKQEEFARRYVEHGNALRAYRETYDARRMLPNTAKRRSHEERWKPAVAERIRQLYAEAAEGTTISARARMAQLQEIVEADPGELVRIVAECCRWCHGAAHAYQWIDGAEYAQALKIAMAAQRVRPRAQRQLPTEEGGYDFDPRREPHRDCPRCGGHGQPQVRITPTDALSPAARRLLKSVRQKASGEIEVRLHDQLGALDMLNRMQGVYIERSVAVNLNAAMRLPETREEQLAFLESLRPGP